MKEMLPTRPEKESAVYLGRHSISSYATNKKILSENPQGPMDPDHQIIPDLTPEGRELAEHEAEAFFDQLNPETDSLFLVSSDQARALETANIYRKVAKKRGFEIIKPKHTKSELAEEIGEGEIRTVEGLSLNIRNMLAHHAFVPEGKVEDIRWDTVSPEMKTRWEKARAIIRKHDYGSWGANFFHHSEKISKLFPEDEIRTAQELYDTEFQNLLRLIRFAHKKMEETESPKNIKVLGFGHENYLSIALDTYFHEHAIGNCEMIRFQVEDGFISMSAKGQEKVIT